MEGSIATCCLSSHDEDKCGFLAGLGGDFQEKAKREGSNVVFVSDPTCWGVDAGLCPDGARLEAKGRRERTSVGLERVDKV